MKSLSEYLLKSMSVNESANAAGFILAFSHEDPENTEIIKDNGYKSKFKKFYSDIEEVDDDVVFAANEKLMPGLYYISHNDEEGIAVHLGVSNLNGLFDKLWKEYEAFCKENGYEYGDEQEIFDDRKGSLLNMFSFYSDSLPSNKNELKDIVTSMIEESYVEGDSDEVIAVVDIAREKVLLSGNTKVLFYDSMDSYMKAYEEE